MVKRRRVAAIRGRVKPVERGAGVWSSAPSGKRSHGKIHHGGGAALARFPLKDFVGCAGGAVCGGARMDAAFCGVCKRASLSTGKLADAAYADRATLRDDHRGQVRRETSRK